MRKPDLPMAREGQPLTPSHRRVNKEHVSALTMTALERKKRAYIGCPEFLAFSFHFNFRIYLGSDLYVSSLLSNKSRYLFQIIK